jgi:exonuclease III
MNGNLKILTWNCNGAFRKKFERIDSFEADIVVIQECEDPSQCTDEKYKKWAKNYVWIGDKKHKGLGVFCKKDISISKNDWQDDGTKYFISARINEMFDLIAVWNQRNNSNDFRYIGQFWKYLQINGARMTECIILGDFNSNKIWDKNYKLCNHSAVVRELDELGIGSLYHEIKSEQQGDESLPTFYMYRKLARPYHIDFIFASRAIVQKVHLFEIGDSQNWLDVSDHLPISLDIDITFNSANRAK